MPRQPSVRKAPFWHRTRLGWVNALGFALSTIYGGWLLLTLFRTFLPNADDVKFTLPTAYVAVVTLALLAMVYFYIMVLVCAARGADFRDPGPRRQVFSWSVAGMVFFLLAGVVHTKFGPEPIPNVARWAAIMFWRGFLIGLPAFALMLYVNTGGEPSYREHAEDDEHEYEHDEYDVGEGYANDEEE